MAKLIVNGVIRDDDWQIVAADATEIPAGKVLLPLTLWKSRRGELSARPDVGVWLQPDDEPGELVADLERLPVIAVHFPKFADGRGYSSAALLRTRLGYRGELRAIGEVLRDQFFYLSRCGFDALQPPAGRYRDEQLASALGSLRDFSEPYQGAVDRPEPIWRRQPRGEART